MGKEAIGVGGIRNKMKKDFLRVRGSNLNIQERNLFFS